MSTLHFQKTMSTLDECAGRMLVEYGQFVSHMNHEPCSDEIIKLKTLLENYILVYEVVSKS